MAYTQKAVADSSMSMKLPGTNYVCLKCGSADLEDGKVQVGNLHAKCRDCGTILFYPAHTYSVKEMCWCGDPKKHWEQSQEAK